jgi:hypothetical protein
MGSFTAEFNRPDKGASVRYEKKAEAYRREMGNNLKDLEVFQGISAC